MLDAYRLVGIALGMPHPHSSPKLSLVLANGMAPTPLVLGTCYYALRL
jgi:hypothetical protein